MTVDNINVEDTVKRVTALIAEEKDLSPALKSSLEVLLLLVSILVNRLGLNSKNSSKPPTSDPFRKKERKAPGGRKPGGQHGHVGKTLQQVSNPNIVKPIPIDRSLLPPGEYRNAGHEARQVIDLDISIVVTEWQAEIVVDQNGRKHVAPFPEGVTRPVQYGVGVKINSVYLSQYQMIPYNRIEEQFADQLQIPISAGSIVNFNKDAFDRLEFFDTWVKNRLANAPMVHLDETGINVNSKRLWLHNTSTDSYSYFYPHQKRGGEALDEIGILADHQGILCHDHWKPYFHYGAAHALCNAHHLRELERAAEQDGQKWAKQMSELLLEINQAVDDVGGCLDPPGAELFRKRYREVLIEAERECPEPKKKACPWKPGKIAKSKSRNLLERLRDFEEAVLRFMVNPLVPFSNNQAENDLRMIKVQQKVSGCFRSMDGAKVFCRIRSYLTTCRKQGVTATEALRLLFEGKWPAFMVDSDVVLYAE